MVLESPAERLRWARQRHGQYETATQAARAFGWPVSTYLGHENGDRAPSREAAKRYSRAYRVRWEWILEGEGQPTAEHGIKVKIVAKVVAGNAVDFYPAADMRETDDTPPGVNTATAALLVTGGAMRGIADENWLLFFDDLKQTPTKDLLGKLCVVELGDGSVYVRVLQPGRRKGRYDLEAPFEPTLRDRKLRWAARITWIKPR